MNITRSLQAYHPKVHLRQNAGASDPGEPGEYRARHVVPAKGSTRWPTSCGQVARQKAEQARRLESGSQFNRTFEIRQRTQKAAWSGAAFGQVVNALVTGALP